MKTTVKHMDKLSKKCNVLNTQRALLLVDTVNEILLLNDYPEHKLIKPTKSELSYAHKTGHLWIETPRLTGKPAVTSYLAEISILYIHNSGLSLHFCDPTSPATWIHGIQETLFFPLNDFHHGSFTESSVLMEIAQFIASLLLNPEEWQVLRKYTTNGKRTDSHDLQIDFYRLFAIMPYVKSKPKFKKLIEAEHSARLTMLGIKEGTE